MITGNPVAGILPITVGAGSKIKFEWSQVCSGPTCSKIYLPNTHDVMEMADLDHYTRCDFTGAKAQGTAEENAARSVTLTMPTPANAEAVQYYACSVGKGFGGGHCAQGQKITVTIMKDPDNCGVDKYCYKVRTSAGDNGDGIGPEYAQAATCVDTQKTKACELSTADSNEILTDACMCCQDKECYVQEGSGNVFVGENCGGSTGKGKICKSLLVPVDPTGKSPTKIDVRKCQNPSAKCETIANDGANFCGSTSETTSWIKSGSKIYNPVNAGKFCAGATCDNSDVFTATCDNCGRRWLKSADITTCCQDAAQCSSVGTDKIRQDAVCKPDAGSDIRYKYDETKGTQGPDPTTKDNYCKAKPCGSGADETIDVSFAMIPS